MSKSSKNLIMIGISLLIIILVVRFLTKKPKKMVEQPQPQPNNVGSVNVIGGSTKGDNKSNDMTSQSPEQTESGYGYGYTGYSCNCRGSFGELFMGRETIDQVGIRGCDCGNAYYPMFLYSGPFVYPYPIYGRYPHKHKHPHKPKPTGTSPISPAPISRPTSKPMVEVRPMTVQTTKPMPTMATSMVALVRPMGVAMPRPMGVNMSRPMVAPTGVAMSRPMGMAKAR